jgi:phosphoribosyl 1,2-cyclic phosphodiesterase
MLPQQAAIDDATSALSVVMSPPFFPIGPGELEGSWRLDTLAPGELEIEGFTVLAREVPHKGGRTYGYRVQDGERSIAYIPDHCPTLLGPGPDGLGEYHDAAVELASEVDVLIHDAHLLADELESQAVYGHAAAEYAVALGRHAGARAVALFHHRPDRTDAALDELAARLDRGQPPVSVAVQGSTVTL